VPDRSSKPARRRHHQRLRIDGPGVGLLVCCHAYLGRPRHAESVGAPSPGRSQGAGLPAALRRHRGHGRRTGRHGDGRQAPHRRLVLAASGPSHFPRDFPTDVPTASLSSPRRTQSPAEHRSQFPTDFPTACLLPGTARISPVPHVRGAGPRTTGAPRRQAAGSGSQQLLADPSGWTRSMWPNPPELLARPCGQSLTGA
jgi:hypothetical protein